MFIAGATYMMKSEEKYIIYFLLVLIQRRELLGSDVTTTVTRNLGDDVRLACTTSSAHKKSWSHIPDGSKYPIQISQMDHLTREYADTGRFQLDLDTSIGKYDLLIKDVNKRDAGIYFCKDQVSKRSFKLLIEQIQMQLKVTPVNTAAIRGHPARLNCSTSYDHPVYWMHTPVGSTEQLDVFVVGSLTKRYSHRYTIEKDPSIGQYDLVIPHVQTSDAGTFECIDDYGSGIKVSAELIVFESQPDCSSNATTEGVLVENDCGLKPEAVSITCNTTYAGNIEPLLRLIYRNSTFECVSHVVNHLDNGLIRKTSSFVFRPTFHWNIDQLIYEYIHLSQTLTNGRCVVRGLKIHYIFDSTMISLRKCNMDEQKFICSANTSELCSYKWIKPGEVDDILSRNQVEYFQPGAYQCIAECELRGTICSFASPPVLTNDMQLVQGDLKNSIIAVVVITAVITVLTVSGAWYTCVVLKNRISQLLAKGFHKSTSAHDSENDTLIKTVSVKINYRGKITVKEVNKVDAIVDNHQETGNVENNTTRSSSAVMRSREGVVANNNDVDYTFETRQISIEQKEVRGVSLLGESIYVIRQNEKVIRVFEAKSGSFSGNITLGSLARVRDMVSCSQCTCLFVADEDNATIHRIHLSSATYNESTSTITQNWFVQNTPESLCSTSGCGLLVTFSVIKQVALLNDETGERIWCCGLEKNPWHAVQIKEDRYAVSLRSGMESVKDNEVCLIDSSGNIYERYGEKFLNKPGRMVATRDGFLFVADYNNNRILLLDSELKLVNDSFITRITNPSRICFDETSGRLWVAIDNDKNDIFVYNIYSSI